MAFHQREITDRPGEERSFGPARSTEEERRRGEVVDGADAKLALERIDSIDPKAGGLVLFLGFPLLIALQVGKALVAGPFPITVVGPRH